MKNKLGFKIKIGGETLLYIIIGIIIFIFVIFMPRIYKFVSDLKTGNMFKGDSNPVVENNNINNSEDSEKKENNIEDPIGDETLVCNLTTSEPEGNLVESYTLYFNAGKLNSIKNEKEYDAITDDYLNFVYSEQSRFNNINDMYQKVPGFNYNSTFESRTLVVTFVYDLSKLNVDSLKSEDEKLSINLDVTKDQNLEKAKEIYTGLGYTCK